MKLKDLQLLLQSKGYYSGEADGKWGPLTRKALEAWGPSGTDLSAPSSVPDPHSVIPALWLPKCKMDRVIMHWTAGGPMASANDLEHYHFLVQQDLKLLRGDESIADNVVTSDGDYAAHTRGLNTGSIGVALCGMVGAQQAPFKPGPYPITLEQWQFGARVAAELCKFYAIPAMGVYQHGEVQARLGIAQRGKWDIMVLPWAPELTGLAAAAAFREEVRKYL